MCLEQASKNDTTKVRVIDRFDAQLVDDEALVLATFRRLLLTKTKRLSCIFLNVHT
jgi:hypothetical protein